jgi:hypothetical protein
MAHSLLLRLPILVLSLNWISIAYSQSDSLAVLEERLETERLYRLGYPRDKSRKTLQDEWRENELFNRFVELRLDVQRFILEADGTVSRDNRIRALELLRECINETLQGQLQVGNEQFLNAGRRKFPSVLSPATANLVRTPYNEQDGWKELAIAALEFDVGILEALDVIRDVPQTATPNGSGPTLRSRGGNETINTPAEGFAEYTIIDQQEFVDGNSNFIRTELNLLFGLLVRRGLTATALVDRIRRLAYRANNEIEGRQRHGEAGESRKEEFNRLALARAKRDAQLMFYSGLVLRSELPASGGVASRDDFKLHNGDKLFTAMNQLNVLFKDIRDGRPPTGIADQFVPSPNKRIGGAQGYLSDAISNVQRAKESQAIAEQRVREYQQAQVSEVELNRNLREGYLTQIGQLTGFQVDGQALLLKDPLNPNVTFDLSNPEKREEFRMLLSQRLEEAEEAAFSDNPDSADLENLGQLGLALITIQQAFVGQQLAADRVAQIPAAIERIESRVSSANSIVKAAAKERQVQEYIEVGAQALLTLYRLQGLQETGLSVNFASAFAPLASIQERISGLAQIKQNEIQVAERLDLQSLEAEFQVKELLANKRSVELESELQGLQVASSENQYIQLRRQVDDLIENLGIYRADTASLYFLDPSLEVEKLDAEIQADLDLQDCLASLYDLTKSLEFYWTEKYQNPVQTIDGGIVSLPNFANDFTELDDLYAITDANDAEKFLNALGFNLSGGSAAGWDSTLRALRQSIPAPNQTVILSLREDILGFRVPERVFWDTANQRPGDQLIQIHDNGQIIEGFELAYAYFENEAITKFRDFLQGNRRDAFDFAFGTGRDPQDFLPGFEAVVSTNENSNYYFDAREWNMRLQSIQIDVRTEGGFIPPGQEENFIRLSLIQEGTVSFRRSFPLALSDAQYDTYQTEFKYRSDRLRISPYEFPVQAGINGSSGPFGGQPAALPYFFSPICNNWRIVLDPLSSIANNYADINRIKDIRLILTLRSGIPPTLAEGL